MTRFIRILLFFYKGFRGTFMDRFTLHADHLDILWFWLMLPHVGHACACYPQGTLHSPNCLLRLSSSGLTTLIIWLNLFNWIMLENSHLKLLMTIACQLGLKLNIQYPMFTPRTAWQRHSLSDFKWLLDRWSYVPSSWSLLGAMQ